jgi:hypothetical protein
MQKHLYFGLSNPQASDTSKHYTLDGNLYDFRATLDLDEGTLLVEDNFGRCIPLDLEHLKSLVSMLAHAGALYEEFKEIYSKSSALSSRYTALQVWPDKAFVDEKRDEQGDAICSAYSYFRDGDKPARSQAFLADLIWPPSH